VTTPLNWAACLTADEELNSHLPHSVSEPYLKISFSNIGYKTSKTITSILKAIVFNYMHHYMNNCYNFILMAVFLSYILGFSIANLR